MVRDAQWWPLVATALLEENIEHLSHSVTCSPEGDMAMQELLPLTSTTEDTSDWSQPVEGDLRHPPSLDPAGGLPWRRDAPTQSGRRRWFLVEINTQTLPQ